MPIHATHLSWSSCDHHLSSPALSLSLTHKHLVVHSHDTFLGKRLRDAWSCIICKKCANMAHNIFLRHFPPKSQPVKSLYTLQHLWGCAPQTPCRIYLPSPKIKSCMTPWADSSGKVWWAKQASKILLIYKEFRVQHALCYNILTIACSCNMAAALICEYHNL